MPNKHNKTPNGQLTLRMATVVWVLAMALKHSGYTGAVFKTAKFVGITNGGQFAYKVTYHDEAGTGKDEVGQVYLSYDPAAGMVTADY